MIIDFHTHCFPQNLAEKAVGRLAKISKINPKTNGTVEDLIDKINKWHIDKAVVLNVVTNMRQQKNVNDFAISINNYEDKIISIGSLHPDNDDIKEEIDRLKNAGIKGIKLHPDYLKIKFDDKRYLPIFEKCIENDMFIVIHAGFDVISPDLIHADPKMIREVIDTYPNLKLVAAHVGGNRMWDDVEKYLVGTNVYIDTSLAQVFELDKAQAKRIFENHLDSRILFGSDAPWGDANEAREYIESIGIREDLKKKIYYKNAISLLDQ